MRVGGWRVRVYTWRRRPWLAWVTGKGWWAMGEGWWVEVEGWWVMGEGEDWWVEGEGWLMEGEGVYLASQALACAGDGCFLPVCEYAMLGRYSRSGPGFSLRMRFLSSRLHSVKNYTNYIIR